MNDLSLSLAASSPTRLRWRAPGDVVTAALVALLGGVAFFTLPTDLALLARIAALSLFGLSVYLVVGLGGVATLGHAVVFGAGAYAAGFACLNGVADPLLLLLIGAGAGALMGFVAGVVILRARGLPQLVLSIATVQFLHEAANKAHAVTGGSDGLSGLAPGPVLGLFEFDLFGRTGYVLSLVLLVAAILVVGRIVASPFGLTCRAIRADEGRVRALGQAVTPRLLALFAVSGVFGGLSGALTAVTTGVVGLDSLGFELSAEAVVMVVFGGLSSPSGAVLGTAVFLLFEHLVSGWSPFHWLALVGLLLIAVVLFLPRGLISLVGPGRGGAQLAEEARS